MIVWGFFVLIESSSEKCLANRWKTEDKRLYYVIKKGRVHYNSLKLVLGDSISFFLHKIPNSKWYTVCFAQLGGKPWKRKKVKNLYWQLLTDSTKCLSNLLIHSSFFLYWYGRSNSFPRKKNVSSESSTNLKVCVPENPEFSPERCTGLFQVLQNPWGTLGFSCCSPDTGK